MTAAGVRKGKGSASGESCFVCGMHVYQAERLVAGGRLFHRKSPGHKGCFNCHLCHTPLSSSDFSSAGSRVYCNAHFRQLFAEHGDYRFAYDEGEEVEEEMEEEEEEEEVVEVEKEVVVEVAAEEEAVAEAEEEEEGEATCYLYGDLQLPFVLEEAWLRVRDPEVSTDWMVLSYARKGVNGTATDDPTLLELIGEGDGGLTACLSCLESAASASSRVFWGGLKVNAIDSRGTTTCERPKFVFFTQIGPEVSTRSRTRGLLHTGAVAEVLQGAHCVFEVEDAKGELQPATVAAKLLQSTGAHKPNQYDFGGGLVEQCEYYAQS